MFKQESKSNSMTTNKEVKPGTGRTSTINHQQPSITIINNHQITSSKHKTNLIKLNKQGQISGEGKR